MKASAIIATMTMISVQPYTLTSWQLEMENINHSANDNINLSVEELEASVTFECLYNIIRQLEGCSPPSPNDRRLLVFENICMNKKLQLVSNTNIDIVI